MDDEKTIAEQVAEEAAGTVDAEDIEQAEDRIDEDVEVDDDEVRDEIRDEDDARDNRLDQILDRIDEIGRHLDERIDGLSRMLIDGGGIITDSRGNASTAEEMDFVDIDELDLV